jgi:peroxiredoxin
MRLRAIALGLLLLASAPPRTRAELKNLNGQVAPDLGRFEQVGGVDRVETVAALKGRVVLLVFFDSSYPACDREAPKLEELWKEYRERGLVLIGVSGESTEKLQAFVEKHRTSYPVLSAPLALRNYAIDGYPTKYLVAPSGKIVASENTNVTAAMIEEQLASAVAYPLLDYSKKFDPCLAHLKARDLVRASTELTRLEKEDGQDGEHARVLIAWIEEQGQKRIARADAARERGDVFEARDLLASIDREFPPKYDCTKEGKERLRALREDKETKKVLAAENDWKLALNAERDKNYPKAASLYMKCAKATAGTKFAERCEAKVNQLQPKK